MERNVRTWVKGRSMLLVLSKAILKTVKNMLPILVTRTVT